MKGIKTLVISSVALLTLNCGDVKTDDMRSGDDAAMTPGQHDVYRMYDQDYDEGIADETDEGTEDEVNLGADDDAGFIITDTDETDDGEGDDGWVIIDTDDDDESDVAGEDNEVIECLAEVTITLNGTSEGWEAASGTWDVEYANPTTEQERLVAVRDAVESAREFAREEAVDSARAEANAYCRDGNFELSQINNGEVQSKARCEQENPGYSCEFLGSSSVLTDIAFRETNLSIKYYDGSTIVNSRRDYPDRVKVTSRMFASGDCEYKADFQLCK